MARPPITDRTRVHSVRVEVRLRPGQYKRWVAAAREHGMSLSAWIRVTLDRAARM